MKDAGTDNYITSNNILVYDWEGEPVVNYKTNRLLRSIKYDEKESTFYNYSVNSESGLPEILTFELPEQK